ncbi:SGNH/GDSL hydrolase family protein [Mucilaginibacter pallidiroseus]|uniref:SGNH/GDSL hydrolase family protein n=1 Tax=Mucilaginibacter pallidiroseus TaxID=2599295 RepID=A0A563U268_9SPHI|nr:SGNH/GDSL hydrolase family protein [Mucilaginibacter pallidiroseus]TWR24809.1 SGNH/GDSL hydrolase family protein [Mucilaginibacter pallidiroseus]
MRIFLLICLLLLARSVTTSAQQVKPFKAGDRVVFTGNSITDGGRYHSFIWLYYMTRMPYMRLDFFNAGIGGDVAGQISERLQEDVFDKRPTVITLTFGMNDTGYQLLTGEKADSNYRAKIEKSYRSFLNIENQLQKYAGARKIMIGSSPYDGNAKIKAGVIYQKNEAINKVIDFQKQAAKTNNWDFVDFNQPMQAINRQQQARDSAFTLEGFDRIHPTIDGHMVMAYLFLKAQGFAGKKIAAISINASEKKIIRFENCQISNLTGGKQQVDFIYKANALPYPTDTVMQGSGKHGRSQAGAELLVPFEHDFNQETLQVAGLAENQQYQVKIDDKFIGSWTASQLKSGINLAKICTTPQYQQALAVMHLNEERWAIERRLREYWWLQYSIMKPHGLFHNDSEATVSSLKQYAKKDFFVAVVLNTYYKARLKPVRDAWQKEMDLLTNEIYRINKPVAHKISVQAVNNLNHAITQK